MGLFSASVTLNCSPSVAFDFLNDQRNHANLNPHNFREFRVTSPDSRGVGAAAEFELKTGPFREQVHIEVTTSEPPALLVEEGHLNGGTFRTTWQFRPLDTARTELELTTEYTTSNPLAGLLTNEIQKAFARIYTRLLQNLVVQLQ